MVALITSIVQASAHSVNLERWLGTIDNIIATPASFLTVILGSVTAQILLTYSSLIITYSSAYILFKNVEPLYHNIPFVIAIVLSALSLISFGIFLAPLFTIGELTFWANSLQYPLYIICGAIIPLGLLPSFFYPLAFIFPPYWAGKILVYSTQMDFEWGAFAETAVYLIIISSLYYLGANFLFKKMLNYARKNASFQMF
jgi:ABC-2 type transport system permease protein